MREEDALLYLVKFVREKLPNSFSSYGYDIYLPNVIKSYIKFTIQNIDRSGEYEKEREFSPIFYNAAWDLCRRGILRPGVKIIGEQATNDGSAGNGYSITTFGLKWIQESEKDSFVPTEPERFGEILGKYKLKFGPGFHERAQQAIRCYGAHAYLACCAMCGASAESIILAAAIAKEKDEKEILKKYSSTNGRRAIENILIGKARKQVQDDYKGYSALLKYWRDEAAHGKASKIDDNEAYTSLALLLRLSMFINDNWQELTIR